MFNSAVAILIIILFISPQEKEGDLPCRCYGGRQSSRVCPSSFLPTGHQGQALAPPHGSASVQKPAWKSHRQRGRGVRPWEEGWVRDPEEDGEWQALISLDHHWGTSQSCRRPGSGGPQLRGSGGKQWCQQVFWWLLKCWIKTEEDVGGDLFPSDW